MSQDEPDQFAPIDNYRNTLLHYVASSTVGKLMKTVFESVPFIDWKRMSNRARKTSYHLIVANKNFYKFACLITGEADIRKFFTNRAKIHGTEIFKQHGGSAERCY